MLAYFFNTNLNVYSSCFEWRENEEIFHFMRNRIGGLSAKHFWNFNQIVFCGFTRNNQSKNVSLGRVHLWVGSFVGETIFWSAVDINRIIIREMSLFVGTRFCDEHLGQKPYCEDTVRMDSFGSLTSFPQFQTCCCFGWRCPLKIGFIFTRIYPISVKARWWVMRKLTTWILQISQMYS